MADDSVGHFNNGVETVRAALVAELTKPPYTVQNQRVVAMIEAVAKDAVLPKIAAASAPVEPPPAIAAEMEQVAAAPVAAERDRHLVGLPT